MFGCCGTWATSTLGEILDGLVLAELGYEGLQRIASTPEGKKAAREAIAYWNPRVATTFGVVGSSRFDTLRKFGLRHTSNEELLAQWENVSGEKLGMLGL